jgi:hypothetical protein
LLHYKISLGLFIVAGLITSRGQFFNDPILCTDIPGVSTQVVNNFCWVHQTYTVITDLNGITGKDFAYPGVASIDDEDIRRISYYQWVSLLLLLQAFCFAIPKLIWKTAENNKIKSLVQNNLRGPNQNFDEKNTELNRLAQYWADNRGTHGGLALAYFVCEALNFINVLGQIFLIDKFLGNTFWSYGYDVVANSMMMPDDRTDPMNIVFPKMSKCNFWSYGPSGVINKYDTLCILPINVVNEKVYIVLWFWLLCVAVLSFIYLNYLIVLCILPSYRLYLISAKVEMTAKRENVSAAVQSRKLNAIQNIGDWLVLDTLVIYFFMYTFLNLCGKLIYQLTSHNYFPINKTLLSNDT